jgi:maleylacetoacetate isomerase
MKLHGYFRSSASYRVRIALNLKGLEYDSVPVNLLAGEQKSDAYRKLNPQGLVPLLADGEHRLTQSLAIMEYLEETHPAPPLLPQTRPERARVRALALAIACEMGPLCNSGPLGFLGSELGLSEAQKTLWYHHWMKKGFDALEALLVAGPDTGSYCHGASPTMADCLLVPQMFNARRYGFDLTPYPTLLRIDARCATHPAFIAAHPMRQPDAPQGRP